MYNATPLRHFFAPMCKQISKAPQYLYVWLGFANREKSEKGKKNGKIWNPVFINIEPEAVLYEKLMSYVVCIFKPTQNKLYIETAPAVKKNNSAMYHHHHHHHHVVKKMREREPEPDALQETIYTLERN